MPVYWLDPAEPAFPNPEEAEPGGLLAVGGALRPEWLVLAYQHGIFPWFEDEEAFFWYAPDPRCVLFPSELNVHKSMRSIFNQGRFRYTLDRSFEAVMHACAAAPRVGQEGTWISNAFIEGYTEMYRQGLAHSVEVWSGTELVGGLYGLSLGKIFFGESMFAKVPNASKAGFIQLVRGLQRLNFTLIDCQQETPHLLSLGARNIPRKKFQEYLANNQFERTLIGHWNFNPDGSIFCIPTDGL